MDRGLSPIGAIVWWKNSGFVSPILLTFIMTPTPDNYFNGYDYAHYHTNTGSHSRFSVLSLVEYLAGNQSLWRGIGRFRKCLCDR